MDSSLIPTNDHTSPDRRHPLKGDVVSSGRFGVGNVASLSLRCRERVGTAHCGSEQTAMVGPDSLKKGAALVVPVPAISPEREKQGDARDLAAAAVGVSGKTPLCKVPLVRLTKLATPAEFAAFSGSQVSTHVPTHGKRAAP